MSNEHSAFCRSDPRGDAMCIGLPECGYCVAETLDTLDMMLKPFGPDTRHAVAVERLRCLIRSLAVCREQLAKQELRFAAALETAREHAMSDSEKTLRLLAGDACKAMSALAAHLGGKS